MRLERRVDDRLVVAFGAVDSEEGCRWCGARALCHARDRSPSRGPLPVTSGPFSWATWPARRSRRYARRMCARETLSISGAEDIQAGLHAAVRGIAGLAPLDDVLQVIVDRVRPLVAAQYAALGIVDPTGRIERFITSGMDDETRARIGPLP